MLKSECWQEWKGLVRNFIVIAPDKVPYLTWLLHCVLKFFKITGKNVVKYLPNKGTL